jgi:hypothetical protein
MDLLEHSREEYRAELERRNELRRALSIPIGLSVVFAGAQFSLFRAFPSDSAGICVAGAFFVFWAMSLFSLVFVIVYLIRSHIGHDYAYIATPKEILEYREKLQDYYKERGGEDVSDQDIRVYLESEYAQNAHHNSLRNNTKAMNLHKANQGVVVTLVGIALSGIMVLFSDLVG